MFIGLRKKRERQRNINVEEKHRLVASLRYPKRGSNTPQLGMCPDREQNLQPFRVLDNAPTNWATPTRARSYLFRIESLPFPLVLCFKTFLFLYNTLHSAANFYIDPPAFCPPPFAFSFTVTGPSWPGRAMSLLITWIQCMIFFYLFGMFLIFICFLIQWLPQYYIKLFTKL